MDVDGGALVPVRALFQQIMERLDEDVQALGCQAQIQHLWTILEDGSSAHRQRRIYESARGRGSSRGDALQEVVAWLVDASHSV